MKWIISKECLPNYVFPSQECLTFGIPVLPDPEDKWEGRQSTFWSEEEQFTYGEDERILEVSHWCPLPSIP